MPREAGRGWPAARRTRPPAPSRWRHPAGLACLLFVATIAVYLPVRHHQFVEFDDPTYVTENPQVRAGLTAPGVRWAFTTAHGANYHPVTWLSHMLDVQIFGVRPGPHHLVNMVFHATNSVLLFLLFQRLTGQPARSAAVGALFALHPLHVESVAWVSERKDVLSTFFWLLTLLAYAAYARRPTVRRYVLVAAGFALGLLAKPMLVTLPFTLLLLDLWPLGRLSAVATLRPLIAEKVPLFVLSAASSVVTIAAQHRGGAVSDLGTFPLSVRAGNALVSYVAYLWQTLWPVSLSPLYPHARLVEGWQVAGAAVFMLVVTLLALRALTRQPWFAMGWFWYVGTLVPVIGLVQVGVQSRADRYTYVPLIGIFIAIVWGAAHLAKGWPAARKALPAVTAAALLACALVTRAQMMHWSTSERLWTRAVTVGLGFDDHRAHGALARILTSQGRLDEAIVHWQALAALQPDDPDAHANLGRALAARGRFDEAIGAFRRRLPLAADRALAHRELGSALADQGRFEEAVGAYRASLAEDAEVPLTHNELGVALANLGHIGQARVQFMEAIRLRPDFAEAHNNLGLLAAREERLDEAARHFGDAVRAQRDFVEARVNLAAVFADQGRVDEALRELAEALELAPGHARARQMYQALRERRR